jgi:hypothetical protein
MCWLKLKNCKITIISFKSILMIYPKHSRQKELTRVGTKNSPKSTKKRDRRTKGWKLLRPKKIIKIWGRKCKGRGKNFQILLDSAKPTSTRRICKSSKRSSVATRPLVARSMQKLKRAKRQSI